MNNKLYKQRFNRALRVRKKMKYNSNRDRITVYFSNKNIHASVIDRNSGNVILSVSTTQKSIKEQLSNVYGINKNYGVDTAKALGEILANKCLEKNITELVFDRGHKKFHGVVKAFADALKEKISA